MPFLANSCLANGVDHVATLMERSAPAMITLAWFFVPEVVVWASEEIRDFRRPISPSFSFLQDKLAIFSSRCCEFNW